MQIAENVYEENTASILKVELSLSLVICNETTQYHFPDNRSFGNYRLGGLKSHLENMYTPWNRRCHLFHSVTEHDALQTTQPRHIAYHTPSIRHLKFQIATKVLVR